jgi:hypothetical protein
MISHRRAAEEIDLEAILVKIVVEQGEENIPFAR